jgi:histidine triad (HIT) family protein
LAGALSNEDNKKADTEIMSDPNCIFCKIAAGEIDSEIVYQTDQVVAFRDLNPQAPTHILIIPRRHIATINDLAEGDAEVVGQLYLAAKQIAADEGFAEPGYRTVMNCNAGAGQTVFHVHLHLLGGRQFGWPPG